MATDPGPFRPERMLLGLDRWLTRSGFEAPETDGCDTPSPTARHAVVWLAFVKNAAR